MPKTAAVITVSDRSFRGEREDLSGPAVAQTLREAGFAVDCVAVVPDEKEKICATLKRFADHVRLVVTTGGTGIARRDVTPEATTGVCERLIPGIAEVMRREGLKTTARAPLSRGVCGARGTTLILNLPGSPAGAVDSLSSVLPLVQHAIELLAGNTEH